MTTILFTRPDDRMGESLEIAKSMGFEAIGIRSVKVIPGDPSKIEAVAAEIPSSEVDMLIFSSVTAVRICQDILGAEMSEIFGSVQLMAMGPGTQKELARSGLNAIMPDDYSSIGVVNALRNSIEGKRIIILRSDKGSDILKKGLEGAGAVVSELPIYGLVPSHFDVLEVSSKKIDVFVFTSAFSAECFFNTLRQEMGSSETMKMLNGSMVAAIGRPTADRLEDMGIKVDVISRRSTFRDLLDDIRANIHIE